MELRVIAVSAPEFPEGEAKDLRLSSSDAASLFNACRWAAHMADTGGNPWSASNWSGRRNRRAATRLYHSLAENDADFRELILRERPTLLLIGAMTLCLPGAIALAAAARKLLGDQVCIVLGGKHCIESIYLSESLGTVVHHPSSPLLLMARGVITPLFDLVVSGQAEILLTTIGEAVSRERDVQAVLRSLFEHPDLRNLPGGWILGTCRDAEIVTVASHNRPIPVDRLPSQADRFGVTAHFDVFPAGRTAHVFSDTGPGCVYSCDFCSEARRINGNLLALDTAPERLHRQLQEAVGVIRADHPGAFPSAFVEDSVLLGGVDKLLGRFVELASAKPLNMEFGAQLTFDLVLRRRESLARLRDVGLSYLFLGLETVAPDIAARFSKDTSKGKQSWETRAERTIELLTELGVKCGFALLFGLGESRSERHRLFELLRNWRQRYGLPTVLSANWGVQHPLQGHDHALGYTYHEWGTPSGELLQTFLHFGEAAERFPLFGQPAPTLCEAVEVQTLLAQFYA